MLVLCRFQHFYYPRINKTLNMLCRLDTREDIIFISDNFLDVDMSSSFGFVHEQLLIYNLHIYNNYQYIIGKIGTL
jgi:hypothetical protein